ncbi:kinase-like domain-containing protein [Mycena pura]|uniref:Kinase-like domain-containing protein n=1 Tax=Mycena pura TaxID=153505 RepID=A0AAD6YC57_9AGAR|nr:kinase-like domain-containing protein [Mycena pura]
MSSSQPNPSDDFNTQSTQPISQPADQSRFEDDSESWGLLIPSVPGIQPVRFLKTQPEITIGRDSRHNIVVLPWVCISSKHAVITWNGNENDKSEVTIFDKSFNGTYFQGTKMDRDSTRILNDGCEISFGPFRSQARENEPNYRYTYRDLISQKRELYKKYDLSVKLGDGAYANVYKALQKGTSKWVAVKVINRIMRHNLTPDKEAGVIREITIIRTLRHPNICAFLEFYENSDESLDIVLEFVDGGDLAEFIQSRGGLTDWMSRHITFQMCKAVAYIHSRAITHRDLKPENILLTLDNPPIVKVADFGMAKLVDEATALQTIAGTVQYMAPEIVMRLSTDKPYTNRVDSWSTGGIIFVMATTQTMFSSGITGAELRQLMDTVGIGGIRWGILDSSENISDHGRDFVRRLLVFEPEERMQLAVAQDHPWLLNHKHTYAIDYPEDPETEALRRTASLTIGGANGSGSVKNKNAPNDAPNDAPPALMRAATVDPYADEDVHAAPETVRTASVDPYADDDEPPPLPPRRNARAAVVRTRYPRLASIPETGAGEGEGEVLLPLPGLRQEQGQGQGGAGTPSDASGAKSKATKETSAPAMREDSDGYLYGYRDLPNPDPGPASGPSTPASAPALDAMDVDDAPPPPRKRTLAEIRYAAMGGSGSLSSMSSSEALFAPPAKRGRTEAQAPKFKGTGRGRGGGGKPPNAGAGAAPRQPPSTAKGKGKARAEDPEGEVEEEQKKKEKNPKQGDAEAAGPAMRRPARPDRRGKAPAKR